MLKVSGLCLVVICLVCTVAFAGGSGNPIEPLKETTEHIGMGVSFEFNGANTNLSEAR